MPDMQKRILILEDSDIFSDMLFEAFGTSGFLLERAVNGFEGIKKVYSFLPHLIITDIEMPLFKGYQVTRLLKSRKNTKNIPVVMFTSLEETKDKFWGAQAGADYYIEKTPDNIEPLVREVTKLLSSKQDIDFGAIEKESKKINNDSIIEITNNLLDNKLFQTTIVGLLAELSGEAHSLDTVVHGIFDLLKNSCEAEIAIMMIRSGNSFLHVYSSNYSGFAKEQFENFSGICFSDFGNLFPDFGHLSKSSKHFLKEGTNTNSITSYVRIPLKISGEIFASLHIANTINDYFSPSIMENLNVFAASASPVVSNALTMHEMTVLQKNTRMAFARYVPADVIDELINETTKKAQKSENRYVSVLFCDIRNFTNIAEMSEAQNVVDFLNTYFAKMGTEIISENGHIDKFIGDAIMAVFGAFHTTENSPLNAIRAAVKMLAALEMINSSSSSKLGEDKIGIGIGINCGECIIGNIGFKNKMDFTLIGDTVNIASRLEGLTKIYRHPLIVSESVYEAVRENFLFRKIDNVRVKGKEKPIGIYAVYSGFYGTEGKRLRSGGTADIVSVPSLLINRETLANYNKGLQVFYMREWKLAQEYFIKSLEFDNEDFLSKTYLERAIEYEKSPPDEDWDGIITIKRK
ncbi:MAG: adenylate/guanylate cyclase domain-containing response regulator [Treponema sp.]|nr:adenylate/guanylate cyclase domain-containing response regulator [Treponema sp.]MCL2236714.1 adenylate/guanylate cyclase domain-containing response regulator [Treponema sp.]